MDLSKWQEHVIPIDEETYQSKNVASYCRQCDDPWHSKHWLHIGNSPEGERYAEKAEWHRRSI